MYVHSFFPGFFADTTPRPLHLAIPNPMALRMHQVNVSAKENLNNKTPTLAAELLSYLPELSKEEAREWLEITSCQVVLPLLYSEPSSRMDFSMFELVKMPLPSKHASIISSSER